MRQLDRDEIGMTVDALEALGSQSMISTSRRIDALVRELKTKDIYVIDTERDGLLLTEDENLKPLVLIALARAQAERIAMLQDELEVTARKYKEVVDTTGWKGDL